MPPPFGILKLNFVGSYQNSFWKGGIGGVIRDHFVNVFISFFGPVDAMDSNKAEVYALLVGYRELLKLGGYFSLIKVDSFSAI